MSAEVLREAAAAIREAWVNVSPGYADKFDLAVADWFAAEAEAHIHIPAGGTRSVYDMPGMDNTPAVLAARAYLGREA